MSQMLEARANELTEGARIIRSQMVYKNQIWMRSILSRNIGGDVSDLVCDIRRLEVTGRHRDNTWAPAGNREAQRRSKNIMGYQVRDRERRQNNISI